MALSRNLDFVTSERRTINEGLIAPNRDVAIDKLSSILRNNESNIDISF